MNFINSEELIKIAPSIVAFIASLISLLVSLKSIKIQKKISNSPLQINYLESKIKRLNKIITRLKKASAIKNEKDKTLTEDRVAEMLALISYNTQIAIEESIDEINEIIDNDELKTQFEKFKTLNSEVSLQRMQTQAQKPINDKSNFEIGDFVNINNNIIKILTKERNKSRDKIENIINVDVS